MLVLPLLLVVAAIVVSKWALGRYQSKAALGRQAQAPENRTGEQMALEFLEAHGVLDVQVVAHNGVVTNYYDPTRRRLFLSDDVRQGASLYAWAMAMHEAAHALQTGDDKDALMWRRTCIRLLRYTPTLAGFVALAAMFFLKIPARNVLFGFAGACALVMLLNLGTVALEYNANTRLRNWLEGRLGRHPTALDRIDMLLSAIATRELGDLVLSPRYFFFTALPGTSSSRPK